MSSRVSPLSFRLDYSNTKVWDQITSPELFKSITKINYFLGWFLKLYFIYIKFMLLYYSWYSLNSIIFFDVFVFKLKELSNKNNKFWNFRSSFFHLKKKIKIKRDYSFGRLRFFKIKKNGGNIFKFVKYYYKYFKKKKKLFKILGMGDFKSAHHASKSNTNNFSCIQPFFYNFYNLKNYKKKYKRIFKKLKKLKFRRSNNFIKILKQTNVNILNFNIWKRQAPLKIVTLKKKKKLLKKWSINPKKKKKLLKRWLPSTKFKKKRKISFLKKLYFIKFAAISLKLHLKKKKLIKRVKKKFFKNNEYATNSKKNSKYKYYYDKIAKSDRRREKGKFVNFYYNKNKFRNNNKKLNNNKIFNNNFKKNADDKRLKVTNKLFSDAIKDFIKKTIIKNNYSTATRHVSKVKKKQVKIGILNKFYFKHKKYSDKFFKRKKINYIYRKRRHIFFKRNWELNKVFFNFRKRSRSKRFSFFFKARYLNFFLNTKKKRYSNYRLKNNFFFKKKKKLSFKKKNFLRSLKRFSSKKNLKESFSDDKSVVLKFFLRKNYFKLLNSYITKKFYLGANSIKNFFILKIGLKKKKKKFFKSLRRLRKYSYSSRIFSKATYKLTKKLSRADWKKKGKNKFSFYNKKKSYVRSSVISKTKKVGSREKDKFKKLKKWWFFYVPALDFSKAARNLLKKNRFVKTVSRVNRLLSSKNKKLINIAGSLRKFRFNYKNFFGTQSILEMYGIKKRIFRTNLSIFKRHFNLQEKKLANKLSSFIHIKNLSLNVKIYERLLSFKKVFLNCKARNINPAKMSKERTLVFTKPLIFKKGTFVNKNYFFLKTEKKIKFKRIRAEKKKLAKNLKIIPLSKKINRYSVKRYAFFQNFFQNFRIKRAVKKKLAILGYRRFLPFFLYFFLSKFWNKISCFRIKRFLPVFSKEKKIIKWNRLSKNSGFNTTLDNKSFIIKISKLFFFSKSYFFKTLSKKKLKLFFMFYSIFFFKRNLLKYFEVEKSLLKSDSGFLLKNFLINKISFLTLLKKNIKIKILSRRLIKKSFKKIFAANSRTWKLKKLWTNKKKKQKIRIKSHVRFRKYNRFFNKNYRRLRNFFYMYYSSPFLKFFNKYKNFKKPSIDFNWFFNNSLRKSKHYESSAHFLNNSYINFVSLERTLYQNRISSLLPRSFSRNYFKKFNISSYKSFFSKTNFSLFYGFLKKSKKTNSKAHLTFKKNLILKPKRSRKSNKARIFYFLSKKKIKSSLKRKNNLKFFKLKKKIFFVHLKKNESFQHYLGSKLEIFKKFKPLVFSSLSSLLLSIGNHSKKLSKKKLIYFFFLKNYLRSTINHKTSVSSTPSFIRKKKIIFFYNFFFKNASKSRYKKFIFFIKNIKNKMINVFKKVSSKIMSSRGKFTVAASLQRFSFFSYFFFKKNKALVNKTKLNFKKKKRDKLLQSFFTRSKNSYFFKKLISEKLKTLHSSSAIWFVKSNSYLPGSIILKSCLRLPNYVTGRLKLFFLNFFYNLNFFFKNKKFFFLSKFNTFTSSYKLSLLLKRYTYLNFFNIFLISLKKYNFKNYKSICKWILKYIFYKGDSSIIKILIFLFYACNIIGYYYSFLTFIAFVLEKWRLRKHFKILSVIKTLVWNFPFLRSFYSFYLVIAGKFNMKPRARSVHIIRNFLPALQDMSFRVSYYHCLARNLFGAFGLHMWVYHRF